MLEALIVTLREGVEAALAVGIIVAFVRREGRPEWLRAVWSGLAAALVASLGAAWVLYRWAVDEEVFEGLLYLASAILVGSMIVWMGRHARTLSGELRSSLGRIMGRSGTTSVWAGLFAFTFLMVFREGVETVFFVSALSLSSGSLLVVLGIVLGAALAVAFGVLFTRGTMRVNLRRFFRITGIALLIFVVQLLVNGYHELAEAGWLPANERSMATIGPLVRGEYFFVLAVLVLPVLLLLVPGEQRNEAASTLSAPEERLERAGRARLRRTRTVAGAIGVVILAALGLGFVYSRPPASLSPATPLTVNAAGVVAIPVAELRDQALHRYSVTIGGVTIRLIALALDPAQGTYVTAFDACEICGAKGYLQDGRNIACLHCGSTIYPPSIGQHGGCNPIPLTARRAGSSLTIAASDLSRGGALFSANHAAGMMH